MAESKGAPSGPIANSPIFSLYIVNKAGGLIYQKDYANVPKLATGNDYLVLASTLHSLHAISGRARFHTASDKAGGAAQKPEDKAAAESSWKPVPSGIVSLEAKSFRLQCFQTLTGLKFFVTAAPLKAGGKAGAGGAGAVGSGAGAGGAAGPVGGGGTTGLDGGGGPASASVLAAKALAVASAKVNLDAFLQNVYRLYTDYVLKNPFYELDMPIRHNDTFDAGVYKLVEQTANVK